jgi:hypothetical protein
VAARSSNGGVLRRDGRLMLSTGEVAESGMNLFCLGEFSVSFEVWSGQINVGHVLFQSPKNIFRQLQQNVYLLQKECYFERIS